MAVPTQYDANQQPDGTSCKLPERAARVARPDPEAEEGLTVDLASARELLRIDKAYTTTMVGR